MSATTKEKAEEQKEYLTKFEFAISKVSEEKYKIGFCNIWASDSSYDVRCSLIHDETKSSIPVEFDQLVEKFILIPRSEA